MFILYKGVTCQNEGDDSEDSKIFLNNFIILQVWI